MTGPQMAAKPETVEESKPNRGEKKRSVLIGVIASLSTALVFGAVLFGVVFYYQEKVNTEKKEWISWTRKTGDTVIHETVLIDDHEQTILIVSAEAYRLHENNSMALHDFEKGYVAIRDFRQDLCLVSHVENPDYGSVKAMLEARRGKQLDLQPNQNAKLRAETMTSSELGPKLSKFCDGVPARWFDVDSTSNSGIVKRQETVYVCIGTATVIRAPCIYVIYIYIICDDLSTVPPTVNG